MTVEDYINKLSESYKSKLFYFHNLHLDLFNKSKGSFSKHQSWVGGYRDHLEQILKIASVLYENFSFSFPFDSVFLVLYFHDIEKLFKYSSGILIDKDKYLFEDLKKYNIIFSEEEINALKYIHGEGNDYCSDRIMNELAGFCHACDVISARTFHNRTKI